MAQHLGSSVEDLLINLAADFRWDAVLDLSGCLTTVVYSEAAEVGEKVGEGLVRGEGARWEWDPAGIRALIVGHTCVYLFRVLGLGVCADSKKESRTWLLWKAELGTCGYANLDFFSARILGKCSLARVR